MTPANVVSYSGTAPVPAFNAAYRVGSALMSMPVARTLSARTATAGSSCSDPLRTGLDALRLVVRNRR
jgi:hypothetical protein